MPRLDDGSHATSGRPPKTMTHLPLDGSLKECVERILEANPGWCTVGQVAYILKLTPRAIRRFHDKHLTTKRVEGIVLYDTDEVKAYSRKRLRKGTVSRLVFTGIEVERLEKICEVYYQTQYDIGQKQLLTLAKRVAKL